MLDGTYKVTTDILLPLGGIYATDCSVVWLAGYSPILTTDTAAVLW